MEVQVILTDINEHLRIRIAKKGYTDQQRVDLLNSVIHNFQANFDKILKVNDSDCYIFFEVNLIRLHFTDYHDSESR